MITIEWTGITVLMLDSESSGNLSDRVRQLKKKIKTVLVASLFVLCQKCYIVTMSHDRNVNVNIDLPMTLIICILGIYTGEGIPG